MNDPYYSLDLVTLNQPRRGNCPVCRAEVILTNVHRSLNNPMSIESEVNAILRSCNHEGTQHGQRLP